jgi:hypothetical protein
LSRQLPPRGVVNRNPAADAPVVTSYTTAMTYVRGRDVHPSWRGSGISHCLAAEPGRFITDAVTSVELSDDFPEPGVGQRRAATN